MNCCTNFHKSSAIPVMLNGNIMRSWWYLKRGSHIIPNFLSHSYLSLQRFITIYSFYLQLHASWMTNIKHDILVVLVHFYFIVCIHLFYANSTNLILSALMFISSIFHLCFIYISSTFIYISWVVHLYFIWNSSAIHRYFIYNSSFCLYFNWIHLQQIKWEWIVNKLGMKYR